MTIAVAAAGMAVTTVPAAAAQIVHVPVAAAAFRAEIPIDATVDCANPECTGTLYFRTTDPNRTDNTLAGYSAVALTMTPLTSSNGHYAVQAHGTIPATATDTRGVDYLFSVLDGTTTSWFPGVGGSATPVPQHVHVIDPVHVTHGPVLVSYFQEPITTTARVTCSTGSCSGLLHYRTSTGLDSAAGTNEYLVDLTTVGLAGKGFTAVPMTATLVEDLGSGQQLLEFTAEVPASAVDTNGVDYVIEITDAYTTAFTPGTSYVGEVPAEGQAVGWHHVEVFSRPQVVHVPPAYYVPGAALQLTAEVTSAAGFPTVTVHYREGSQVGFVTGQLTVRETPVRRPEGTVYIATGAIPGSFTAQGGLMIYALEVDDGHQSTYSPAPAGYLDSNLGYAVAPQSQPL